jgi:hypothetical protein
MEMLTYYYSYEYVPILKGSNDGALPTLNITSFLHFVHRLIFYKPEYNISGAVSAPFFRWRVPT